MIVYDKNVFGSNREIDDTNGYLRVSECNITKAQVRPYKGEEIPCWRDFNLDPEKIYNVVCLPEELEKAAETFNNLPLTRDHIAIDVNDVPKERIIGSLGDHAVFEYPYLKNNIIVYDKKDIDNIMNGKRRELSCGYRYTPIREEGEFDGQHYDFKMTDIIGNHVAIVKQGRAGHDVMVADTIEMVKDKIMGIFSKKTVNDEFKESEHPRAKNGQFTSAGGSGSENKEKSKSEKTEESKAVSEYREHKLKELEDIEAVFGKESDAYKEELAEIENGINEAKDYVKAVIDNAKKRNLGDKDRKYFEDMVKATKESYGENDSYYKTAKLHLDLYNEMMKSGNLTEDKASDKMEEKELPAGAGEPEKAGEEEALNQGVTDMAEEVKEVETKEEEKVVEPKEECSEMVEDKSVDKRKLIDEIGGILEGKIDDELIKTILGKAEELAYNGSEKSADDEKPAEDEKIEEVEEAKESKEEKSEEKKEDEEPTKDSCGKKEMAKDSALVMDADAIRAEGRAEALADYKAREIARKSVRSIVGDVDVFAFDSADEIYKFACEKAGMDLTDIASYKDAFRGLSARKGKLAMDASPISGSNEECFKDIRLA